MHHVDRDTPWDEIWQAMDLLVAQGKVIYVGSSNFAGWHLVAGQRGGPAAGLARAWCRSRASTTCDARTVELEVLPAAEAYGIGVIPWSPLGGGLLGGALRKVTEGRRGAERVQQQVERHRDQLEAWEGLCEELGEEPADVALAWLLHQPAVTAPIIGPRTPEQFEGSLRALEITLDQEVLDRLDKIFPGPGGSAPEAYAW